MQENRYLLLLAALLVFGFSCFAAHAAERRGIPVCTTLPAFKLQGPTAKADQEYLCLKDSEPFTLAQVCGKLVIIEFLGVF
jgi:hypothetical protein